MARITKFKKFGMKLLTNNENPILAKRTRIGKVVFIGTNLGLDLFSISQFYPQTYSTLTLMLGIGNTVTSGILCYIFVKHVVKLYLTDK